MEIRRVFQVNGKPFFSLGGQSRNSSGYNREECHTAFEAVKALHGNTLEIPVYWEQIEPEEGHFDFRSVDILLEEARARDLKLVLLWFGTWKNGDMEYTPAWVKRNPERFVRVTNPSGNAVWVLSPHCQANLEADRKAFCAFMEHLHRHDDTERTVIAVQVENEPGILGSDRDYGPLGEEAYRQPVPQVLLEAIRQRPSSPAYRVWQEAGARTKGTWEEVFGTAGGEFLSAWAIARYIDQIAEAGKAIHDVPMYVNVWLGEQGWQVAGDSYPSGGAVGRTLEIYKATTPHIDLIAPDIYIGDSQGYRGICELYARDDNPLFVPESAPGGSNAWNLFYALANYGAIGYHFFAIEHIFAPDGTIAPECQPLVESIHCVASAIPLLLKYQGTDRIHAVVREENLRYQHLDLDGYIGLVEFEGTPMYRGGKDWRHRDPNLFAKLNQTGRRGRGLVFQEDEHTFYLVGAAYRLHLRRKGSARQLLDICSASPFHLTRGSFYVSVDEGHFDQDGNFVVDRRRNGDETDHGIWVEPDVGVVRVVLCD